MLILDLLKKLCLNPEHPQLKALNADLIIKNDRLLGAVANLTAKLAEANKPPPAPPTPVLVSETILIDRSVFVSRMQELGVIILNGTQPIDKNVRLASKAELDRIAKYLKYPSAWYTADLWDCEDMGLQAQLDAGRLFEISVRLGLGMISNIQAGDKPIYHGFAMTLDSNLDMWLLEPNDGFTYSGVWFKQGEHGYVCDKVFI